MFRIHRSENGEVVFTISDRLDAEHVAELETLIVADTKGRLIPEIVAGHIKGASSWYSLAERFEWHSQEPETWKGKDHPLPTIINWDRRKQKLLGMAS
jgi:hypothetical protein